jgi:NADH dehydrogenase [ubiquinone] 1 alpha subcomplex assembly factor 7
VTPLEERLIRRITATGPITVAEFIAAALTDPDDGYYRRAEPPGAAGDFVTAPEISQLFGEMIGAWLIDCWEKNGRPSPVRLVELGPGRGTLMADVLRVGRLVPAWLAAAELHLVEINPKMRRAQAERLGQFRPIWHDALATVPAGPLFLVANEFLDALPIRQLVYLKRAWRERLVGWTEADGFHYLPSREPSPLGLLVPPLSAPVHEGAVFELSPPVIDLVTEISRRVVGGGGAALLIDYGRMALETGDTLQAVRGHTKIPALESPGLADISTHVDFALVRRVAREAGAHVGGPQPQAAFLAALGIFERAGALKRNLPPPQAESIDSALRRLTDPTEMGGLFKALSITPDGMAPSGFDV